MRKSIAEEGETEVSFGLLLLFSRLLVICGEEEEAMRRNLVGVGESDFEEKEVVLFREKRKEGRGGKRNHQY